MLNKAQKAALRQEFERIQATLSPMPTVISRRTGCKVSWYSFATKEEAAIASEHAKLQAEYYGYLGYDYGYYSGGEILKTEQGTWEVVFP
jgi:hypothetical protein